MKIRLFPILVLAFAAFISCEREIVIEVEKIDPYIIMNAQLHTDDSSHSISLTYGRQDGTDPCSNADVKVYINDNSPIRAEEIEMEEIYEKSEYVFDATIRPGDRVRIEASAGGMSARAEVVAPEAPVIEAVEFSVKDNPTAENPEYARRYVFNTKIKDLSGKSYYRCRINGEYELIIDTTALRFSTDVDYLDQSGEPLLTAGWSTDDGDEFNLSNIFTPQNEYSIFTDETFPDGEYSLNLQASVLRFNSPWFNIYDLDIVEATLKPTAIVKIYSLSFLQYRYIISLYNYEFFGYEMSVIAEPVSLPSNVEGGLGFVSIDSCSEFRVLLPEVKVDLRYY